MNKHRILILILALLTTSSMHSQVLMSLIFGDKLNSDKVEFGLEGGFNFSNIDELRGSKRFSSFNLGFYFDIALQDHWRIYTGVLVKSKLGSDELTLEDLQRLEIPVEEEDGTYTQKLNYFLVPALIKYKFDNRMYLETGPQFGLRSKAFVEFYAEAEDGREIEVRTTNTDQTNPIEAGWLVGTGYHFSPGKGMSVGVKYHHGFTNVYKNISGSTNSSIFVKMTIPIGANKGKLKESEKKGKAQKEAHKNKPEN